MFSMFWINSATRRHRCIFHYYHYNSRFPNYTNSEDVETKLAFTIVTHDVLLYSIFRPYNGYCIYLYWIKYGRKLSSQCKKLVNCYNFLYPESNVFMAVNTTAVKWARWSVIKDDLICMEVSYHYIQSMGWQNVYQNLMSKFQQIHSRGLSTLKGGNSRVDFSKGY